MRPVRSATFAQAQVEAESTILRAAYSAPTQEPVHAAASRVLGMTVHTYIMAKLDMYTPQMLTHFRVVCLSGLCWVGVTRVVTSEERVCTAFT